MIVAEGQSGIKKKVSISTKKSRKKQEKDLYVSTKAEIAVQTMQGVPFL